MSAEKNNISAAIGIISASCALIYSTVRIYPLLMTGSETSRAEFYSHALVIVFTIIFVVYICMRVSKMEKDQKLKTDYLDKKIQNLSSEVKEIKTHMDNTVTLFQNMNINMEQTLKRIEAASKSSNERAEKATEKANERIDLVLVELSKCN